MALLQPKTCCWEVTSSYGCREEELLCSGSFIEDTVVLESWRIFYKHTRDLGKTSNQKNACESLGVCRKPVEDEAGMRGRS